MQGCSTGVRDEKKNLTNGYSVVLHWLIQFYISLPLKKKILTENEQPKCNKRRDYYYYYHYIPNFCQYLTFSVYFLVWFSFSTFTDSFYFMSTDKLLGPYVFEMSKNELDRPNNHGCKMLSSQDRSLDQGRNPLMTSRPQFLIHTLCVDYLTLTLSKNSFEFLLRFVTDWSLNNRGTNTLPTRWRSSYDGRAQHPLFFNHAKVKREMQKVLNTCWHPSAVSVCVGAGAATHRPPS